MSVQEKSDSANSPASSSHSVEEREGYLYVHYTGEISVDDLVEITDTNHANPRFKEMNDLWDLREAYSYDLDYGRIRNFVEYIQKRGSRLHKRSAIVVEGELHFGLSRIYQSLAEEVGEENFAVKVWGDLESAKTWLNEGEPTR